MQYYIYSDNEAKTEAQAGDAGVQDAQNGEPEEEMMEIDEDDPEMQAAASRIQAQWKGKQARREVNVKREAKKAEDQLIHEEQSAAAVKIQSRYRGKKARRQVEAKRQAKVEEEVEENAADEVKQPKQGEGSNEGILTENSGKEAAESKAQG